MRKTIRFCSWRSVAEWLDPAVMTLTAPVSRFVVQTIGAEWTSDSPPRWRSSARAVPSLSAADSNANCWRCSCCTRTRSFPSTRSSTASGPGAAAERDEERPRARSRLRRLLDGEAVTQSEGEGNNCALLTRAHGYLLKVAPGEHYTTSSHCGRKDESALAAGQADVAARTLREALAVWRGPPLAEFAHDSFAVVEIARLNELRLTALEERIEADLAAGRSTELVAELEALVAASPYASGFAVS